MSEVILNIKDNAPFGYGEAKRLNNQLDIVTKRLKEIVSNSNDCQDKPYDTGYKDGWNAVVSIIGDILDLVEDKRG